MKIAILAAASMASLLLTACGATTGNCNVNNCAGCCSNDVCQSGTANTACGKNATTCVACAGAQVCSSAQVCAFDGASLWRVQPLSATVKNNNNGAAWDADDSAADPAVELFCPANASDRTATTATVTDSYSPTWSGEGCVVSAQTLLSGGFAYQVVDQDLVGSDPITTKTNVTVTEANLLAGSAAISASDGLTALSIALQKQ